MKLHTINTGFFKLDGGAMFGVVPKVIWNQLNPADENNLCNWAMRCLLIEEGDKLILVDNGIGNKQDARFFSHYYLHGEESLDSSLKKNGFSRDDVTDVVLTHLHFDHCGGSVVREGDKLVPAFKNARFWSNQRHWQWAVLPNDREKASFLKENILPIKEAGQLAFIRLPEKRDNRFAAQDETGGIDNIPVSDGPLPSQLSFRFVDGHTAGMMLPQIKAGEKTIVFVADLIPSAAHVPLPYVMAYDMFPLTTLEEKKSFLTEAASGDYILYLEHDPIDECCTVKTGERGVRKEETFRLSDI